MIKKILITAASVILSLGVLTGCGNKEKNTTTASEKETSVINETTANKETKPVIVSDCKWFLQDFEWGKTYSDCTIDEFLGVKINNDESAAFGAYISDTIGLFKIEYVFGKENYDYDKFLGILTEKLGTPDSTEPVEDSKQAATWYFTSGSDKIQAVITDSVRADDNVQYVDISFEKIQ